MTRKTRAEGVLLALTLIWGSTFVVGKLVLVSLTPLQMIAMRFTLATAILLVFFPRRIFPLTRRQIARGGILGIFLFLGFVAQTVGLTMTSASKSAFITGMMVVFVPLLQVVIERRSPRIGNLAGVGVVTAGLWLLTSPAGETLGTGDALTLLCAVLFAVYIVYIDVVAHEMTALQLTFIQMASNAIFAVACSAAFDTLPARVPGGAIVAILYLTLFATVLTTFMQTRYQKETTPTRAAVIFTIEPVFAAVSAAVVLGEQIGVGGALGGGLIIGGVLLSELSDGIPLLNRSVGSADS
ncbi:MAG TPA: EamA family transporter [Bacteroidota bacterium]|nr:EamA family transporter [Bacteroidota bacterium]